MKPMLSTFLKFLAAAGLVFAAAAPACFADDQATLPPGPGRDTLQKVCTACHDIDSVPRLRYSRADWTSLVYSMKDMGADATTAELDQIIDYLTKNFGKADDAAASKSPDSAASDGKAGDTKAADGKAPDSQASDSKTSDTKTSDTKAADAKTNVNKASADEIMAGLGFSDKEAAAIVAYRDKNGDFKDADALAKVDGVDAAKVTAAKDKMAFSFSGCTRPHGRIRRFLSEVLRTRPNVMRQLVLLGSLLLSLPLLASDELPQGAGKDIIAKHCAGCHPGAALARYQKTREDWDAVVTRMGQRTEATHEELNTLTDYLATNFPKVDDPSKVNMNKADSKEMEARLGLTAKEADAIVEYRERRGNFHAWGDLLVIYGLDGTKVEALQDKMSF